MPKAREPRAMCAKCGSETIDANALTGVGTLSVGAQFLAHRGVPTRCVVCTACGYVEVFATDPGRVAHRLKNIPQRAAR